MNIRQDFEQTRRRETLRQYQEWLAAKDEYRRSKNEDRGGMFPAVCWLVGVVIVAAVVGAVLRQVS